MSGGPYPVMVFLHGGGHQQSANIQYPGHFLADKDVVVVVPNYRYIFSPKLVLDKIYSLGLFP